MAPATLSDLADAAMAVRVRWRHSLSRWVIGAVAGAASAPMLGWRVAAIWTGCWAVTQVVEVVACWRVARGAEMTPARLAAAMLTLAVGAFVFSALSAIYWVELGERGGGVAALIVAGALLNALVLCNTSRRLFLALAFPAFFFLALQPILALIATLSYALLAPGLACVACVMGAGVMVWRHAEATRRAEREARFALEAAVARAEAAVAAKSAFVAMVGHELRTPISGVLAASGELERSADPQTAEHGRMIAESGRLMRVVLNDLLDLAKLEAGRMAVEATAFDVRLLLDQACRFWSVEAADKGISLGVRGLDTLPRWVEGDPTRLRQILNNLLSNAVKFTENGGVSVLAQAGDDTAGRPVLRIAVADTGPGISAEALSHLFTPFTQADASTARLHGGTGLGLAISRQLARLMEGELEADSHLGAGSTFSLKLPLRTAQPRAGVDAPELAPETAPPPPPGLRILVADDHAINRRAVRLLLSPLSPVIAEADNGAGALLALAREPFDLVLMDLRMPDMSGVEVVRRLRAAEGPNRETRVLAVTASTEDEDIAACLDAGMDGFVAKPIDARELLAAVSRTALTPVYAFDAAEPRRAFA